MTLKGCDHFLWNFEKDSTKFVSDAKIQAELQKGHLGDSKRRHGNQMIFWDTKGVFFLVCFLLHTQLKLKHLQRCNFPHFIPPKSMFCQGPWPPMQTQTVHLLASWLHAVLMFLQCKTVGVISRRADQMTWRKVLFEKKKKCQKRWLLVIWINCFKQETCHKSFLDPNLFDSLPELN